MTAARNEDEDEDEDWFLGLTAARTTLKKLLYVTYVKRNFNGEDDEVWWWTRTVEVWSLKYGEDEDEHKKRTQILMLNLTFVKMKNDTL